MARGCVLLVALVGCGDNGKSRHDAATSSHDAAMSCTPTLSADVPIPTEIVPRWLTVVDATGDSVLDVLYGSTGPLSGDDGVIGLRPGRGDGTFGPERLHPTGTAFDLLAFGDVDGDGRIDAVTAIYNASAFDVHLGIGDGGFAARVHHPFAVGTWPRVSALAIGAWTVESETHNGIIVTRSDEYMTEAHLLAANGTELTSVSWPLTPHGASRLLAVRDLNGDGDNEIVAQDGGGIRWGYGRTWSAVTAVRADEAAMSGTRATIGCGGSEPDADLSARHHLHIQHINGDPYLDVVAMDPSGDACVISSTADSTLTRVAALSGLRAVVPLDFAGDNAAELVTFTEGFVQIVRATATSDGTGQIEQLATHPFGAVSLATAGDVDRDGVDDVVTAAFEAKQITVLRGSCTP